MNRRDMRPGQIVERRERYVVTTNQYPEGLHKLHPIGGEFVLISERWRVRRVPARGGFLSIDAYWLAKGGVKDEDGYREWNMFDTHAEAIAYADRRARLYLIRKGRHV